MIIDNGLYQISGKQRSATAGTADIVAIARGAGIANSHWARDEAHFDELTSRRFDEGGPALLAAKIDDNPGTAQTPRSSAVASCRGSAPDAPARWTASAPIPKFASYRGEFDCELRN